MNSNLETWFFEQYTSNAEFQEAFKTKRIALYCRIVSILREIRAERVLDLGCAYGFLVELCNMVGMDAYGFELPIPELQRFHDRLRYSQGKILYGSLNSSTLAESLTAQEWDAILLIDTLRLFDSCSSLSLLKPRYWIVKDISSNNPYIRYSRHRRPRSFEVKLWSPVELLRLFKGYSMHTLYASRFILKVQRPSAPSMSIFGTLFPTYTAILSRKSDY